MLRQEIIDDVRKRITDFITSEIGGTKCSVTFGASNVPPGVSYVSADFDLSEIGYDGVERTVPGGEGTHSEAS